MASNLTFSNDFEMMYNFLVECQLSSRCRSSIIVRVWHNRHNQHNNSNKRPSGVHKAKLNDQLDVRTDLLFFDVFLI